MMICSAPTDVLSDRELQEYTFGKGMPKQFLAYQILGTLALKGTD
jgi:hypothetical protein